MADQAERVILEAEDEVTPVVGKANTSLESFEKKAESSHGKVIRITDQTRSSVQRLIASMEKQAEMSGKSGVEKLVAQRDQLLQRYAKEPAAIDAITRSYEKQIAVATKAAQAEAELERKRTEAAAARERTAAGQSTMGWLQDPIGNLRTKATEALTALGPFGGAVAGVAVGLGTLAVAGFEAAKSLGEYGTQVKDVELRTGLTAKEVGQFSFAARAAGQDVQIFERMMRGLTMAIEDDSSKGEKARGWLKRFNIDMADVKNGTASTSDVLQQIAEGLDKLPTTWERNKAALDIFKKSGIEAIPVMMELTENLKLAREQGFGPTEADVARFKDYQREVIVLETKWESLKRTFKEGLVIDVKFIGSAAKWLLDHIPGGGTVGGDIPTFQREVALHDEIARANAMKGKWGNAPLAGARQLEMLRWRTLENLRPEAAYGPTPQEADQLAKAEQYRKQIEQMQHDMNAAKDAAKRKDQQEGAEEADRLRARYFGGHDALERAYNTAKKDVEKYQEQLLKAKDDKLVKSDVDAIGGKLATASAAEARAKAALDAAKQGAENLHRFRSEAAAFEKKGDEAELDAIGKIYYQRDELLKQAAKVKTSETEITAIRQAADDQALQERVKQHVKDLNKAMEEQNKLIHHHVEELNKDLAAQHRHDEQVEKTRERIEDIGVQAQRETLQRKAARAGRMAELTAGSDEEAAQQAYGVRVQLAIDLARIEAARIAKEADGNEKAIHAAQAKKDLFTELAQARDQFDEKQAQIEQKRAQELQSQIDGLQKQAEKLFDVLFTKPKNFGKDLLNTIHSAAIKPAVEMLSGKTAELLHPIIYGKDGSGGLSGLFHGTKDPVRVSTDQNTVATIQNSTAIASLTALFVTAMGVAAPTAPGLTGTAGGPSLSVPSISMPSVTASMPALFGGGASPTLPALVFPGPGRTGGGGAASLWPSTHADAGTPPFLPGGGTAPHGGTGLGGILGNLKGSFWNQDIYTAPGRATTPAGIGGIKGDLAGGLTSQGAAAIYMAAGMPLSMAGLTGSRRGTWGGIAESTAGGALVGAGIGTMVLPGIGTAIGAGIGAATGFGASVGEKLFGVKSLDQTAHDDIRAAYGIDIPTNSGTIKQVVSIAQSQYGGSISIAVRSPSVRQLVMLYSEATGQKTPLSATTPYAGSLVEQGSKLYQQASYQDGQAHTYTSNLPTLAGISGGAYPTPGGPNTAAGAGPTYLSLNISGNDAANFMTGQFVTPQFVADQSMAAQNSSYARTQQAANTQLPGLTIL